MQLTGPKKLLSNCSRTRVCARGDAASSSTVPTSAIVTISLHPSTPVIYGVPNLHLSSIAVYPISQMSPQPQQQQPDTGPSHCSPHISPFSNLPNKQPSNQVTRGPHTCHPTPTPYTSPSTPLSRTPAKSPETHPLAAYPFLLPLLHRG